MCFRNRRRQKCLAESVRERGVVHNEVVVIVWVGGLGYEFVLYSKCKGNHQKVLSGGVT